MLIICLLSLPWMADPAGNIQFAANVLAPVPTCSRPLIQVTQPSTVSALSPTEISDALEVTKLLRNWERSTASSADWSRSQREEFRRRMKQEFNGHSVAATEQLMGPIKRDTLIETYDWRIAERSGEQVCLEATPRDDTERLFYGSVRVWLDAEWGSLQQIAIVNRHQESRVAWQTENARPRDVVQLVHFENDVPPAPRALLRTANTRAD